MKTFLKDIEKSRKSLLKNRKKFFEANKKNFEKNLMQIINNYKISKPWKVYVVAGNFAGEKNIMPYDYDAWSSCFLVCATKKQGYEMMLFLNKAKSFLSIPGLVPLVAHEIEHIKQGIRSPKKHLKSIIDDKSSQKDEREADLKIKNLYEFRKQLVLESVLYCFDKKGWKGATKMADFFYKKREKMYGGGYLKEITKEEHDVFIKAKKERNIKIFMDFFN